MLPQQFEYEQKLESKWVGNKTGTIIYKIKQCIRECIDIIKG